ncbi:LysM peptidoglycan-binding domain-containing protein [Facklamia hominis]|uniref:LysM domain-containing protein n=2 Tax=Facklamia hominis TaxID=178214 RepID=K1LNA8_9LACT|nr:LysM domain-containing protein [Facklamia hominis]EKB56226.1 hypothetical protein HMPREF9706_00209 [Facklamia hominis CCUG 36813]MDK7186472.1 LysM domain-containing protein [Facklamia hominis]PKY93715.1 LysM domain-containing protein [Facklamia hominis]RYC98377.1 LysM domain-containing protein [Facklamia hominis]WPJ89959.1 LysM domain-containing protein [Facklamia hominis]
MTQDNEHFEFDEQESNDLNKSKKFSAPWNKKFGEDENFKKRQYSRSARNTPDKEATTLSQVLLFVLIVALISPFILFMLVNSQRNQKPVEKTAEQVRMTMSSESKKEETTTTEETSKEDESVSTRKIDAEDESRTNNQDTTTSAQFENQTTTQASQSSYHTVGQGESWWSISRAYGVDVYQLASANGASIDTPIHPGTQIIIP